jgi:hypothetical protein
MFATTNSSVHPVKGPGYNSYASGTRMNAPYGVTKTNGTNTTPGVVITCFDCHNVVGTPLTRRTVTAHGNAVSLRGTFQVASATLCNICHAGYTTAPATNPTSHGPGSALNSSGLDSGMATYLRTRCDACHSSTNTAALGGVPIRPVRSEDAHGFNRLRNPTATDTMWPTGATNTYPPYAFIRAGYTTQHKPLSGPSVPTGTATCSGYGSTICSRSSMGSYSPGGVY